MSCIDKLAVFHSNMVLKEAWGLTVAKHLLLLTIYIENRTQKARREVGLNLDSICHFGGVRFLANHTLYQILLKFQIVKYLYKLYSCKT